MTQMDSEEWQKLHDLLRENLQKEIYLTRELLSNMHQEEVSLILHDKGSLNWILQQRSQIMERLSLLRLHRIKTTEKIEKMASQTHPHPTLDEILPPNEEISTEILSLSDQLMALTERMNRQHNQNQRLAEYGDHTPYPSLQPTIEPRPKKKVSVTTYQINK